MTSVCPGLGRMERKIQKIIEIDINIKKNIIARLTFSYVCISANEGPYWVLNVTHYNQDGDLSMTSICRVLVVLLMAHIFIHRI